MMLILHSGGGSGSANVRCGWGDAECADDRGVDMGVKCICSFACYVIAC